MNIDLIREELLRRYSYDELTGNFISILPIKGSQRRVGSIAGCSTSHRYVRIRILGKCYYAHRLVWLYVHGYLPETVDHINGDGHDNRLCNLREASQSNNNMNRAIKKPYSGSNNVYPVDSVSFVKHGEHGYSGTYFVRFTIDGERIQTGPIETFELAEFIADEMRKELYGEFLPHKLAS